MELGARIRTGRLLGFRSISVALFLAAFAPAVLALAQEGRGSDQLKDKGGYVLVDLGEFRLWLERACATTEGMPPILFPETRSSWPEPGAVARARN